MLLLATAICTVGCAEAPTASAPAGAPELRTSVEASTAAFHQALRTNDVETFMSYVADDVVLMPPGEAPVRGKAEVRRWYETFLSQYRTSSLLLTDKEVFVGGDWAAERGAYEWGLTPTAGGAPVVDRGSYLQIWARQPQGEWRFAREIYNSSVPAPLPGTK
jgi:ketosteroid isomerase-like protein